MTKIDADIAAWQREGPLFNSCDHPELPGDRVCVETHNVYHHANMVQLGPFYVHKAIYEGYYHPPTPDDYQDVIPVMSRSKSLLMVVALVLIGVGIGLMLPL